MDTISISDFRKTCTAAFERVRTTGLPLLITRRGDPIAQILPPPGPSLDSSFGSMAGTIQIHGDIVEPAAEPEDWNVLR